MAKVTVEAGIYDAQVEVSGLPEVETGTTVRIFVRTGRKSGTGDKVYDEPFTVYGTHLAVDVYDLDPETWYTANASLDGGDTWIGAVEFETDPEEAVRPENWEWWYDKDQGEEVYIEAEEWNAFCERIDEFRLYEGVGEYSGFTTVYSGDEISAKIVNQARAAMIPLDYEGSLPAVVEPDDPLAASFFNKLRDALNSIP